ncbi:agmatinase [soil metagenome]
MPRTILPDARVSPRFAGISTFCRYPRLEDVAPENRPIDWALLGVPFDGGVTFRSGARFGPRAVRDASQYVKRFHLGHNVDVCDALSLCDAGDAPIAPFSIEGTHELVCEFAERTAAACAAGGKTVSARPPRLLAIGGDHSLAEPMIAAAFERAGRPSGGIALVHVDAHLDTVDSLWGEKHSHGSAFRRVIEEGWVDAKSMLSLGVRGPLNAAGDMDFARACGMTVVPCDELAGSGGVTDSHGLRLDPVREFVARVGQRAVYVTFDIDVVDPAFAPGTGTPNPGGLASRQALALVRALRGINLIGADVVEVLPDRDPTGITALLAAHVAFEILALDAVSAGK